MKYWSFVFLGLVLIHQLAFAESLDFGKILSIEPTTQGNKIIYELGTSDSALNQERQKWKRFVSHDDDGFLTLTLIYRALISNLGQIKSSRSAVEWERIKKDSVPKWESVRPILENAFMQLKAKHSDRIFDPKELDAIGRRLFLEREFSPTWEIFETELGSLIEKKKKRLYYQTKNMSDGKVYRYYLYQNDLSNPVVMLTESQENFRFPFNSGMNLQYSTHFENLIQVLTNYNRLVLKGNFPSFRFPVAGLNYCQELLTGGKKRVRICKKDYQGFRPKAVTVEYVIHTERPEHSLPGIWIGVNGKNRSLPMNIEFHNNEAIALAEIQEEPWADLLWSSASFEFALVLNQIWDSNFGHNYTALAKDFEISP